MSEKAVDMMEYGAQPTDRELDALNSDAMLVEECRDIFIAAGVLTPDTRDTDLQLERFHRKHNIKRARTILYRMAVSAIVTAACITAFFVLISNNEDNGRILFEAEFGTRQPLLTDCHGVAVPLKMYVNNESPSDPIVIAGDRNTVQRTSAATTDTVSLWLPKGHSCRVDLTDGTKVYLHPGSRLSYPSKFGTNSRRVHLEGEAYFVVAKDSSRPFIVCADKSETIVTGTEFNIITNGSDGESVTLVNGKINFMNTDTRRSVELMPGQKATLSASGTADVCEADTMQCTAWRDGYHYYDEATVADILRQISTSYNISIECHNRSILSYRMHYVVRRDISLQDAIRSLNRMEKVHAELVNEKLIVR